MIPRTSWKGDNSTAPGVIESDPAAWVEYKLLTAEQRQLDALARALSIMESARPNWHSRAACRGSGVDFTSKRAKQRAAAFQLCGGCEVRAACLRWAIEDVPDDVGILGGLDAAARRPLIREHERLLAERRQTEHEPEPDDGPDRFTYTEEYPDATP